MQKCQLNVLAYAAFCLFFARYANICDIKHVSLYVKQSLGNEYAI